MFKSLTILFVCVSLVMGNVIYAQTQPSGFSGFDVNQLPKPGERLDVSTHVLPCLVKGLGIDPQEPLQFDFIIDNGKDSVQQEIVKQQALRMAKYFLAAITVPEQQLWVNLSPYEKNRIIENDLGQTVLGRDMLAQDYVLKQLTASMLYPETGLGKIFWAKVYKQAQSRFGTTNIPINAFNKVWIMPKQAEIFEKGTKVFVTKATLKVMLDLDRTASMKNQKKISSSHQMDVAQEMMREIILPAIEKEVNEGKNFTNIRQIYYAAILAKWYRELIQNTLLAKFYLGQNKIDGLVSDEKDLKEKIYQRYIAAYKKGVFNYIKEESASSTEPPLPRKYFGSFVFRA
ncbi:MAG: hypothetical protein HQL13_08850, partial [Candidatus Omnitrophica bacterium]|nr:hypothetical protein [Candidatus Omnitrophota bacterium]